jgi:type IV pilus assembly protein PilE
MHSGLAARERGFSLVELLVVVVMAAILASIAYASYTAHLVRPNRNAAQSLMLDAAVRQKQFLLEHRVYTDVLGVGGLSIALPPKVSSNYSIALTVDNSAIPATYVIVATPLAGSRQVSDGTLTLTSQGTKLPAEKWQ